MSFGNVCAESSSKVPRDIFQGLFANTNLRNIDIRTANTNMGFSFYLHDFQIKVSGLNHKSDILHTYRDGSSAGINYTSITNAFRIGYVDWCLWLYIYWYAECASHARKRLSKFKAHALICKLRNVQNILNPQSLWTSTFLRDSPTDISECN